ncbi:asparagine synthase-domain-containing protein [Rhodocollybia butyracea]|uniref:Asparagine synthase-domain-containing protein n=1 Tax=Rhodocollybia butyracea TaxID=206335 RepID=A0A9P5Q532_9AGAR|nr:asparagine synthase-domain-containing protein [Rhodocollybia butyracea]
MCGIFAQIGEAGSSPEILCQKLRDVNATRGPDARKSCCISLSELRLELFSSELRLRGRHPVVQPHNYDGNILCWNGEVFAGLNINADDNDGIKLFEQLHSLQTSEQVRDLFASIEGPYAFVFYNATVQKLFFSRDPLGRRSLLIHKPSDENPYVFLASVSAGSDPRYSFEEVDTTYIHCLDIKLLSETNDIVSAFDSCLSTIQRGFSNTYAQPAAVNVTIPPDNLPLPPGDSLDVIRDWLQGPVDELISQLDRSVMLQVRDIPQDPSAKGQARVAVLFSGGIDCTILTLLADRYVPRDEPIDLLNVAFENPRKINMLHGASNKNKKSKDADAALPLPQYMVPDRVTGLQEVQELRKLCPGRVWNFVEVNVPYLDYQGARQYVEDLMHPVRTVMDLSLAVALYFASRGIGQVRSGPGDDPVLYTSPAKVLVNGLGSDELLGGYGRHRSAFIAGGWSSVIEELQLEIDRIPMRNLGRDDRVISSHGKETRHPFLSLDVVAFLANLPVQYKVDLRLPVGVGDKMLLRLATRKLGLVEASERKKRAMQFGSRSARMEGDAKGDVLLE